MKRQATAEQKAAAEARRERFRAIVRAVAAMSDEQRAAIVERIGAVPTCEGRVLSVFNSCLILTQHPQASMVGGFRQWLDKGRAVKKGEHSLMIWIPKKGKESESTEPKPNADKEEMAFFMGTVFDISQTIEVETSRQEAA